MTRLLTSTAALLLIASITACSGESGVDVPVEGLVNLTLTSPATNDGGLVVTIRGAVVGAVVSSSPNALVFSHQAGADLLRVAIVGNNLSGSLLRVRVPNVDQIGTYTLTVEEVSGPDYALRTNLAGYSLALVR